MKKYYIFGLLALLFATVSCSDWTEPATKNIDGLLADADAAQAKAHEAYLANLRAYKQTDPSGGLVAGRERTQLHVASIISLIVQTLFLFGMVSLI